MKTYTVNLAATDPFRATFRTFEGIPGRFTVEPAAVELTDQQAAVLAGYGLVVVAGAPQAADGPDETASESKGRVWPWR